MKQFINIFADVLQKLKNCKSRYTLEKHISKLLKNKLIALDDYSFTFKTLIIMKYPLISEYIESIKHSEDNFNVLSNLRPVYDEAGEIVMSSGNFAVVFKMEDESSGKLYAVKCFLKEQEGRDIAYQQITDELEYASSTYLCSIKYF